MKVDFIPYKETIGEDKQHQFGGTCFKKINDNIKFSENPTKVDISDSTKYIEVGGDKYYHGIATMPNRKEVKALITQGGKILQIGSSWQVEFTNPIQSVFGTIIPIFSIGLGDEGYKSKHPHYIDREGNLIYLNGELVHGRIERYMDTVFGEISRVQTSVLHDMFTCLNSEGEMIKIGRQDINHVGRTLDTNIGTGSMCRVRSLWAPVNGYFVDEHMEVFPEVIQGILNATNKQGERVTYLPGAPHAGCKDQYVSATGEKFVGKGNFLTRPLQLQEMLTGCHFPELCSTSYGMFWNTEKGVINSSGEQLKINERKIQRILPCYSRGKFYGVYKVLFKGEDTYVQISEKQLMGKDIY